MLFDSGMAKSGRELLEAGTRVVEACCVVYEVPIKGETGIKVVKSPKPFHFVNGLLRRTVGDSKLVCVLRPEVVRARRLQDSGHGHLISAVRSIEDLVADGSCWVYLDQARLYANSTFHSDLNTDLTFFFPSKNWYHIPAIHRHFQFLGIFGPNDRPEYHLCCEHVGVTSFTI